MLAELLVWRVSTSLKMKSHSLEEQELLQDRGRTERIIFDGMAGVVEGRKDTERIPESA